MNTRIAGIDYLRAIMSIFVVIWHMDGGGRSLIFSTDRYLEHAFSVSDFINFHLLLLAVPTFIFLSIYLYASKPASLATLRERFSRVLILLLFWPTALIIYKHSYHGLLTIAPDSLMNTVFIALTAGYTIFYFFTSLLICLLVSHFYLQANQRVQVSLFLVSTIVLLFLPQITKITGVFAFSAYWSPLNFIPLSFAAVILAQRKYSILKNNRAILLLAAFFCVSLSILEWKYSVGAIFFPGQGYNGYAIPAYTRTSLLFAVIFIFVIAQDSRIKSNRCVDYMSKYSLALYCLHPFFMDPVRNFVDTFVSNKTIGTCVAIFLVVIISYFTAMILEKYYLKEKVIV
jgi:surface polysaccharide O-acyltransferase-like enzyme